jgi:hypothetical protein
MFPSANETGKMTIAVHSAPPATTAADGALFAEVIKAG